MPIRFDSPRRASLRRPLVPHRAAALPLGALCVLAACSSGDDDDTDANAFVVRNTGLAIASGTSPLLGSGDWLAFLVSEAAQGASGTDYNQDGDTLDSIAARVDTGTRTVTVLDVAAQELAFARSTLFMAVSEAADGRDWNGDMDTGDRVLLYATPGASTPAFLDTLSASTSITAIGGTVVYANADAPASTMETNVFVTVVGSTGAAPGTPAMALTGSDPNNDGISFRVTGSDGDVVFLRADETVDGDLNGDMDATDTDIFAVMDAGEVSPTVIVTGRSIAPSSTPTAVPVTGGGEWLVAFLVDESAEGVSLNDPADFSMSWTPPNCSGADTDTLDSVLFWFQISDLSMGTQAVNTGLIGDAAGTAYALRSQFVGVVSPEDEQGTGVCNLNGDGDESDMVFRWVAASNPAAAPLPVTTTSRLVAVDTSVPGGSGGVVRMADTWVILADEAADGRDWDTQPGTNRKVVLAHNPTNGSQTWNAAHGGSGAQAVAVSWMAEDPDSASRFFAAFVEEALSIGGGSSDINGDGDNADSVPTVPVTLSANVLSFPGVQFATNAANAGITVEQNVGFHRVSEAAQGATDLNGDGDATDQVLQRFSLTGAFERTTMGTLNTIDRPAVEFGPGTAEFGAFLFEEFERGVDLNGDGDTSDFVVRYFRMP